MSKRLTLFIVTFFLLMSSALGLTEYGSARVLKGDLTVVRNGKIYTYTSNNQNVSILTGDVLQVGQESRVILNTVESTQIRLGSNSVFQVKPWKKRQKTGYARLLYGKLRFITKKMTDK